MSVAPSPTSRPLVRHLALLNTNSVELAKYYVDVFGMELIPGREGEQERFVTDGYFNLALLYQRLGRGVAANGLNHFGFQVASRAAVAERIVALGGREPKPRPATIPFAEYRGIDPEFNGFDISELGFLQSKTLTDEVAARYAKEIVRSTTRPTVRQIGMYVLDPENVAQFYVDGLGMEHVPSPHGDTARYVTDGYVTLAFQQYLLEGHPAHGLNYFGFFVPSIEEIAQRIETFGGTAPALRPATRPYDVYRAVDPAGNWFDLTEYASVAAAKPEEAREPAHA
jgi:catechol-2,3-dioxygenase